VLVVSACVLPVGLAAAGGGKPVPPLLTVSIKGAGTATSDSTGISCPPSCSALFYPGSQVELSETPDGGSLDATWKGCTSMDGSSCVVAMNGAPKISATFPPVKDKVDLTVTSPENGYIVSSDGLISCPAKCTASYAKGTDVKLQAEGAAGYALQSWGDLCTGEPTLTCATPLENFQGGAVSATFSNAPVTLSITATSTNDDGTSVTDNFGHECDSTNDCQFPESPGALVTLTENTPLNGFSPAFDHWGGVCQSQGQNSTCTVRLDVAKTATATFHDV
jgi:hypothetical protein